MERMQLMVLAHVAIAPGLIAKKDVMVPFVRTDLEPAVILPVLTVQMFVLVLTEMIGWVPVVTIHGSIVTTYVMELLEETDLELVVPILSLIATMFVMVHLDSIEILPVVTHLGLIVTMYAMERS